MKTHDEVEREALRLAHAIAQQELGHEVHLEVEHASRELHGTLFRTFQEHVLGVWRVFSHFDVFSDADGRVLGYVDHEAYREAPEDRAALPEGEIERLIADEEVLPPHTRITKHEWEPGPEGGHIIAVAVESGVEPSIARFRVDVNPTRRSICAVRPLEGGS